MPEQAKSPSLAQDILTLGDIYLTLGWVAIQRLRHGPLWPWEVQSSRSMTLVVLHPSQNEDSEEPVSTKPPAGT
jgi:hypothetical protein